MLDVAHINDAIREYAKAGEWSERGDASVVAAYIEDGLSLGQIARQLDMTIEGVRQKLLRRGVELRPQGKR